MTHFWVIYWLHFDHAADSGSLASGSLVSGNPGFWISVCPKIRIAGILESGNPVIQISCTSYGSGYGEPWPSNLDFVIVHEVDC